MKFDNKVLYLVRHAKAVKATGQLPDIDRPLNDEGISEAYTMAGELLRLQEKPQLIISSSATRAASTALIFQRALHVPESAFRLTPGLYEIDLNDLYDFVSSLDDRYHSVMLVGHNPSFSSLSAKLDPSVIHMPTGSVVKFEFEIEKWRHSSYINAQMKLFLYP